MHVCMYVLYVETRTRKLLCSVIFIHNYYTKSLFRIQHFLLNFMTSQLQMGKKGAK